MGCLFHFRLNGELAGPDFRQLVYKAPRGAPKITKEKIFILFILRDLRAPGFQKPFVLL
jgi:hypothetical protein